MKILKKLVGENFFLIFIAFYLVVRVLMFNINYAEWGDTFRMIRAAEFLSNGYWPWDEKRWPFYSVLLIPGIWLNSSIFWGRFLSFLISLATFAFIYRFYIKLVNDFKSGRTEGENHVNRSSIFNIFAYIKGIFRRSAQTSDDQFASLAVMILALSPVYAYWSFRVMADLVFALLILVYAYYFIKNYQKSSKLIDPNMDVMLSLLLLCITMTRLEGLFMLFGSVAFFALAKNAKKLILYIIPQALVYFPFTLYAKVLYNGPISNDYLKEAQNFVFNFERLAYFFTSTIFILVFPPLLYFLIRGIILLKNAVLKADSKIYLPYLPLGLFILQELLIGFIWTPSLPRIYMPIIPFLVMLAVYGFGHWIPKKNDFTALGLILFSTIAFAGLQYSYKLYFLGASKVLFGITLLLSLVFVAALYLWSSNPKIKSFLAAIIVLSGLISSSVIIYNQKDIYKSVYQGAMFARDLASQSPYKERIAYADETGTTSWYLKDTYIYYLEQDKTMKDLNEQYKLLSENEVSYLIVTNEFNRGSQFLDPKADPRYSLAAVFSVPVYDLADYVLNYFGLMPELDSDLFITKVYKVL